MQTAQADPASASRLSKGVALILTLTCVMGLGAAPAIWCLGLYYGFGDLPCDREIATPLMYIGWCGVATAIASGIKALLRQLYCPPPTPEQQRNGEVDSKNGKCLDQVVQLLLLAPNFISLVQWFALNGICWWMFPYSESTLEMLDNGTLVPCNGSTSPPFWQTELWAYEASPNLLCYGITGCHPDLLFGARGYLICAHAPHMTVATRTIPGDPTLPRSHPLACARRQSHTS